LVEHHKATLLNARQYGGPYRKHWWKSVQEWLKWIGHTSDGWSWTARYRKCHDHRSRILRDV